MKFIPEQNEQYLGQKTDMNLLNLEQSPKPYSVQWITLSWHVLFDPVPGAKVAPTVGPVPDPVPDPVTDPFGFSVSPGTPKIYICKVLTCLKQETALIGINKKDKQVA